MSNRSDDVHGLPNEPPLFSTRYTPPPPAHSSLPPRGLDDTPRVAKPRPRPPPPKGLLPSSAYFASEEKRQYLTIFGGTQLATGWRMMKGSSRYKNFIDLVDDQPSSMETYHRLERGQAKYQEILGNQDPVFAAFLIYFRGYIIRGVAECGRPGYSTGTQLIRLGLILHDSSVSAVTEKYGKGYRLDSPDYDSCVLFPFFAQNYH